MPLNSCDQCEFKSESNKGVKIHMGKMHEAEYHKCNEIFGGELKLKTHVQYGGSKNHDCQYELSSSTVW